MKPVEQQTPNKSNKQQARRQAALNHRDRTADGKFYYAVKTTGVYCRSSCPARQPRRENMLFFGTGAEAEKAGFRPCKRCQPNRPIAELSHGAKIAAVCRLMETAERMPTLAEMAQQAQLSPYHFHRVFRHHTGLTPKAYGAALRAGQVQRQLASSRTVTEAIYGAGYNSSGRFYSDSTQLLGMTPSEYRSGGSGLRVRFAVGRCSLGALLVAASEQGICAISLGDDAEAITRQLQDQFPRADLIAGDARFENWIAKVVGYIDNPAIGLDLPLDIRGTAFQQRVWQALRRIPIGTTVSYSALARQIGASGSARAVARACASNTLAIAIPCHRVIRTDGKLSGYRWGIARKEALLAKESSR